MGQFDAEAASRRHWARQTRRYSVKSTYGLRRLLPGIERVYDGLELRTARPPRGGRALFLCRKAGAPPERHSKRRAVRLAPLQNQKPLI